MSWVLQTNPMLRNYFKIAWRNILRHKLYSAVNILGLSLGICVCIVIYLIVSYEFSFDNFHPDKERVYRVMGEVTESTGDKLNFARVPPSVSQAGRNQLPGVETIAGIIPYNAKIKIPVANAPAKYFDSRPNANHYVTTVIAEPQYFDIFKFEWLAGSPAGALSAPFAVVLTESRARQYFGDIPSNEMIGREVVYEDSLVTSVAGIIKDWKGNSDLVFTDLISFATLQTSFLNKINTVSWGQGSMSALVFAKIEKGVTAHRINSQMADLVKRNSDPQTRLSLWLEPVSEIHFNSDIIENQIRTAHKPSLYSLMFIALFILILAIINFINLSTAQSFYRSKEVGIRKVLGSNRSKLVMQFLVETFLLALLAVSIAITLVNPVLTSFQSFIPEGVSFAVFNMSTIVFLIVIIVVTTVLAGLYPAKLISASLPSGLRGPGTPGGDKWLFRKGLIVFQFTVSLLFIIGSIVIASQLRYTREKDLGFIADAIITTETPRGEGYAKVAILAQKIKALPGINNVALQWLAPMTDNPRGMKLKFKSTDEKDFWVTQLAGNEDFVPLYQIKLLAGRNLVKSDSVNEFVINESLALGMGNKNPRDAVGKFLYWNDRPYPVVGVVADFHTSSLHDPITPLCIINRPDRESSLGIKLASKGQQSGMISNTIAQIENEWKKVYPGKTFTYRFFDESLSLLYEKDRQTAVLMNTSTAITIFISCIGLFGLALFTAQKRAKEISIRKILGAGIGSIVAMLGKDFVRLVIIAFVIASPVAWWLMDKWLEGFVYRIQINIWIFIVAGGSAICLTILTIGYQAIKAAYINPIKDLRSE